MSCLLTTKATVLWQLYKDPYLYTEKDFVRLRTTGSGP